MAAIAWDAGWTASVDGRPLSILRVNHAEIGVPLAPGLHRVALRHSARGLAAGLLLFSLGAALLGAAFLLARARRRRPRPVDPSPNRVLA